MTTTPTLREAATKVLGMELATKHAVYLTAESAGKLVDLVLRAALAEQAAEQAEPVAVPAGYALVPVKATTAMLRPFYACPPEELELAWQALLIVAKNTAAPPAPARQPAAWMHPDGRVVPAATMEAAERDGGAMRSSLAAYTIPLAPITAAPAEGGAA